MPPFLVWYKLLRLHIHLDISLNSAFNMSKTLTDKYMYDSGAIINYQYCIFKVNCA